MIRLGPAGIEACTAYVHTTAQGKITKVRFPTHPGWSIQVLASFFGQSEVHCMCVTYAAWLTGGFIHEIGRDAYAHRGNDTKEIKRCETYYLKRRAAQVRRSQ